MHGGPRKGAGRKTRLERDDLDAMMDKAMDLEKFWQEVAKKVVQGDAQAQKLWAGYRIGTPTAHVEVTGDEGGAFVTEIIIRDHTDMVN